MSLLLPPFFSLVIRKSEKTEQHISAIKERHDNFISEIRKSGLAEDDIPTFIREDNELFVDIVGESDSALKVAVKATQDSGLECGVDFTWFDYNNPESKVDWIHVDKSKNEPLITLKS